MELTGANAFYNQPNYEQKTKEDLAKKDLLGNPVYTYEDRNSWVRLGKIGKNIVFNGSSIALIYSISKSCIKTFSRGYISLPKLPNKVFWITTALGLYNNLYIIAGCLIHPAATPLLHASPDELSEKRGALFQKGREVKRITIKANGYLLDALILGRKENLGNGRWIVFSNGNAELYERVSEEKLKMADNLNANILLYNYASTGRSEGSLPNRQAILASHRAMLSFLEKEIKATEIIDFAHSIGGGIQGENLKTYPLKSGVKYVFVKHMTFATLSNLAGKLIGRVAGVAVRFLNWDYSSVESSKNLAHPEIIIQQGNSEEIDDGFWSSVTDKIEKEKTDQNKYDWKCDNLEDKEVSVIYERDFEHLNPVISIRQEGEEPITTPLYIEEIDESSLADFMKVKKLQDKEEAKKRFYAEYMINFVYKNIPTKTSDGGVSFSAVDPIRKWSIWTSGLIRAFCSGFVC